MDQLPALSVGVVDEELAAGAVDFIADMREEDIEPSFRIENVQTVTATANLVTSSDVVMSNPHITLPHPVHNIQVITKIIGPTACVSEKVSNQYF